MLSVKSITPNKTKTLHCYFFATLGLLFVSFNSAFSQDNSPYSRFGIGDLVPNTSVTSRGMGGISAGYSDLYSINFNNPASYFNFQADPQAKSKKLQDGRAVFDVGMNFETRKLSQTNPEAKFTAYNALFSYAMIGVPIKKNWGIAFGLRPVSRISYKIFRNERLKDPVTGQPIDSALTRFEGDGGSYIASVGTGFTIYKKETQKVQRNLSFGFNAGYYFGKKDYSSKRTLINDTVEYFQGNFQTKTSFGNLYFNTGVQYRTTLGGDDPNKRKFFLTVGAYGTWQQQLNARQDRLIETFIYDPTTGDIRLDSVSDRKDVKGKVIIPGSATVGFTLQKIPKDAKDGAWMIGVDFSTQAWENYRFYGQVDSLRNKWEIKLGTQIYPSPRPGSYFTQVVYRFGLFFGPDYVKVQNKLNQFGASFGMGLPVRRISPLNPNQRSMINIALEYIKRGNSQNIVKENQFRVSVGFAFSDLWFIKRRYD
jgi:hypothetical protein